MNEPRRPSVAFLLAVGVLCGVLVVALFGAHHLGNADPAIVGPTRASQEVTVP